MNAMALLCTLHAEGPKSLAVLKRSGVADLPTLVAVGPVRLAAMLGTSPSFALRFWREGRLLAERVGAVPLDPEEVLAEGSFAAMERPPERCLPGETPVARGIEASRAALAPGRPEGLDADTCGRLAQAGILTIEALARAPGMALARRIGIGLPRLLALEQRALELLREGVGSEPVRTLEPRPRSWPMSAAAQETRRAFEGTGGPFA